MSRRFSLSLAAALGLTALAATTFAQQFVNDQRSAKIARDPARVGGQTSADLAPGGFNFTRVSHPAATPEEVGLAIEADQLARQLGQAKTDDEKEKLKAKITDVLNKQFDQRQRRHESEIEAL